MSHSALEFLFSLERFGMKFGLANMAQLCEALGHPERAFRSVIVGGTNGKGSVTVMTETALRTAGHRVARYTSPHLVRLEERFVIDGHEVEAEALEAAARRVQHSAEGLVATGVLGALPTFFECTTAIAFDLFRQAGVQIAILEVGLGGRLDATNIVSPVAAALVSIDFDHQAQLGATLTSIAWEKAGIVKPGVPLVCGHLPDEARSVVERVCAEQGAPLIRANLDIRVSATSERGDDQLDFVTPRLAVQGARLALRGEHQVRNAAVALRLLDVLDSLGIGTDVAAVRSGLTNAVWPGRLEEFSLNECPVLVDAAHNAAGAKALSSYLLKALPDGVTLVFGAMKDKAVAEMLGALAPVARWTICTTAPSPRAMDADRIADLARPTHARVDVVADPFQAVERACTGGRAVVVAGSIFLVGPVRERLAHDILP